MASILTDSNVSLAISHQSLNRAIHYHDNGAEISIKQTHDSCYRKFRNDSQFRKKVLYTMCLYGAFISMSLSRGHTGPAFLDLQSISGIGTEKASWMLSTTYIGYMIGALVSGVVLYNRFNRKLQFAFNGLLLTLVVCVIPWCSRFELMITAFFVLGLNSGFIDAVANTEIIHIWGAEGKSPMQALHFMYAFGVTISPLYTVPFLAMRDTEISSKGNNSHSISGDDVSFQNYSMLIDKNSTTPKTSEESRLFIAYQITASFTLLVSLAFFVLFYVYKGTEKGATITTSGEPSPAMNTRPLPSFLKGFSLCIMAGIVALMLSLDESFVSLLTLYCVNYLKWTKTNGSLLTAVCNSQVLIGRLLGIFMVKCVSDKQLVTVHCLGILLALIAFYLSSIYFSTVGIWVSACVYGYSRSVIFASVLTWTDTVFTGITGSISSFFFTVMTAVTAINPFVLGILMEQFSPLWFCFIFLGESTLIMVFVVSALALSRYVENTYGLTRSNQMCDGNDKAEINSLVQKNDYAKKS